MLGRIVACFILLVPWAAAAGHRYLVEFDGLAREPRGLTPDVRVAASAIWELSSCDGDAAGFHSAVFEVIKADYAIDGVPAAESCDDAAGNPCSKNSPDAVNALSFFDPAAGALHLSLFSWRQGEPPPSARSEAMLQLEFLHAGGALTPDGAGACILRPPTSFRVSVEPDLVGALSRLSITRCGGSGCEQLLYWFQSASLRISAVDAPAPSPGATPTGSQVTVTARDAVTGAPGPATLTFTAVTGAGDTVVATSSAGNAPPSGFRVGSPAVYYDVTTTAAFVDPVEICIDYGSTVFQTVPRLFHLENGAWVDVTTTSDPSRRVVCGSVTTLSPFAVFEVDFSPVVDCFGTPDAHHAVKAADAVCAATVDNANQLAGGCAGGAGGLASCTFNGAPSLTLATGAHRVEVVAIALDGVSRASCTSYVDVVDVTPPVVDLSAMPALGVLRGSAGSALDVSAVVRDQCDPAPHLGCDVLGPWHPGAHAEPETQAQLTLRFVNGATAPGTYELACDATDASANTTHAEQAFTLRR